MIEQEAHVDRVDVLLAVAASVLELAAAATRRAGSAFQPLAGMVLTPRWLPTRLHPERWMEAMSQEGEARRAALRAGLSRRLDEVVPVVLTEVVRRAHLTDLLLHYVDLDRVVSAVDLDAAAARLDVSAVVERVDVDPIVSRVDLDAAAARLDVDAVLARIDLTSVVLERVDLDALIRAILARIDLTSVVLERVDLDALIRAVLARIDLTSVVLERVDLDALIRAVLARIDLVALAAEVIEGVDLPEIIRESTGSMASDTVRGVRMQGIVADEAVGRVVDRILLRRGHRSTQAPTAPHEPLSSQATIPAQGDRAP